jgi:hypothetical protein
MSDSITQSLWQGFNMAHTIDQDKRLREAMALQEQARKQEQQFRTLQTLKMLSEAQRADEMYPTEKRLKAAQAGKAEKEMNEPPKPENRTLENVLAEKVKNNEITLTEALKMKRAQEQEQRPSIPLFAEKQVGQNLQKFKYNPETKEHDIPFGEAYPRFAPKTSTVDEETRGLNREQKKNLIAERIMKKKFGVMPSLNTLTGETVFPTNPATNKPFTTQEWAQEADTAYREASGEKAAPQKPTDKPLDTDTAKKILSEAGGDKNKARVIAKSRGYKF